MARGLYRDQQGCVMVQYDKDQARMPHDQYVDSNYQPRYDELPTHEAYNDAPHAPQKAACTALEKEVLKTPQDRVELRHSPGSPS
jgi:hypothetical protein